MHVEQWLRRGLGDAQLAARVEELVRHRDLDRSPNDSDGEAALVMRAIAVLDPLAPLCWRGVALWPDGHRRRACRGPGQQARRRWCGWRRSSCARKPATGRRLRAERCDFAVLRVEARQQHSWLHAARPGQRRAAAGLSAEPADAMRQSAAGGRWVARLADLLPALEEAGELVSTTGRRADRQRTSPPSSPPGWSGAWTRSLSAQAGAAMRPALPGAASRAGAVAVATARRARCRGSPPGSAREPGRCWRRGGTASAALRWRSDCGH